MRVLKLLPIKLGIRFHVTLRDGSGYEPIKGANGAVDVNINGSLANQLRQGEIKKVRLP
ncbi:hypothetical protein [Desulfosporosinus nitroreducens]|uniref:hypothetical protein n=1 Tax=Desulfosporosinus nitroreducens TaxID=2018668 RepID=UPI00207CA9E0|nr:hypothetical protein [Desulfosporosinus nitroreducens]MCO1601005.1 hypothetical protein [Desulfosporosinus nitroreducens]